MLMISLAWKKRAIRLYWKILTHKGASNLTEKKAFYLLINLDLKIIKTVFIPGQKKGKKFMVSKRENEVKGKI